MGRRDGLFEADARQVGDLVVLSLTGELDMATAPELHQAVERAQDQGPIVVDLRELEFIDSMGIRALIQVYTAGQNGHSTVSFIRANGHVQRILEIAGVEGLLAWAEPPDEGATDVT
jgi:anti-anti-sigma factor